MLLRLCFVFVLIVSWVLVVFFLRCRARVAPRSMRPKMSCPSRMSFYPQSRQLGVGEEVELEVELVGQVIVDRGIYKMMNLSNRILRRLIL